MKIPSPIKDKHYVAREMAMSLMFAFDYNKLALNQDANIHGTMVCIHQLTTKETGDEMSGSFKATSVNMTIINTCMATCISFKLMPHLQDYSTHL
jgi:hypothetical protein